MGDGLALAAWAAAEKVYIRCDNAAVVRASWKGFSKSIIGYQKAIGTSIRLFQQILTAGAFGLEHIRSEANPADIFTKALPWVKHTHAARLCGVELGDMPAEEE